MEVNSHQVNIEEFFHHTIKALSEPNSLLIIMQASIGDFIANGCLAHALKKKYNKELILVVQDRLSGLKVKFDGISKIKYIPFRVMYPLVLYILNTGRYEDINEGYVFGHFKVDIKIAIDHYLYDKELNFFDRYKKNVFDMVSIDVLKGDNVIEISYCDKGMMKYIIISIISLIVYILFVIICKKYCR